jgi:hypothetical protein
MVRVHTDSNDIARRDPGITVQAATTGWAQTVSICRKNNFGLLAAAGPILRQFLVTSGIGGLTDDAVSAYGLAMKIEHAKIQIIVTIEIQLTVRAAGSAS